MNELTHEDVIREIRVYIAKYHNLRIGEFAKAVGYSAALLSSVLKGATPPPRGYSTQSWYSGLLC